MTVQRKDSGQEIPVSPRLDYDTNLNVQFPDKTIENSSKDNNEFQINLKDVAPLYLHRKFSKKD
jgi:hypothetical protein